MKILNSVQELWDACLYCPICQKSCRTMQIAVGPDQAFELSTFDKSDNNLLLQCVFRYHRIKYLVEYLIDCQTNSFSIESRKIDEIFDNEQDVDVDKAKRASFYCYMQSFCKLCDGASSYSTDIEFDLLNKTLSNFKIEKESFFVRNETIKFHISMYHDRGAMLVSASDASENEAVELYEKPIELPLLNLDFTNIEKVINRIKTLILFS